MMGRSSADLICFTLKVVFIMLEKSKHNIKVFNLSVYFSDYCYQNRNNTNISNYKLEH